MQIFVKQLVSQYTILYSIHLIYEYCLLLSNFLYYYFKIVCLKYNISIFICNLQNDVYIDNYR